VCNFNYTDKWLKILVEWHSTDRYSVCVRLVLLSKPTCMFILQLKHYQNIFAAKRQELDNYPLLSEKLNILCQILWVLWLSWTFLGFFSLSKIRVCNVRFEVFTGARTMAIFSVSAMPLQPWGRRRYVFPKRWHLPTSVYDAKIQKKNIINVYNVFLAFRRKGPLGRSRHR
jgi:hypothetical protein